MSTIEERGRIAVMKALNSLKSSGDIPFRDTTLREDDISEVVRRVRADLGLGDESNEELKAWKTVIYATIMKTFGAQALPAFVKEFESQTKDVFAPHGGTENFTNTLSPGQKYPKIEASPAEAG